MKILACAVLVLCLMADEKQNGSLNYRVFRSDGAPSSLEELLEASRQAAVTFLGESHDDPTAHALELEILQKLSRDRPLKLSLEMFERDTQSVLDEYLAGQILEEHLTAAARPWQAYKSDYRPLIEYAKEHKLPVIAANAPRRYVNRVSRLGQSSLESLDAPAKALLPPLPYTQASPKYAAKFQSFMDKMQADAAKEAAKEAEKSPGARKTPPRVIDPVKNLAAQSLWDASMAHSIAETLARNPTTPVLHINGSFHSENRLGIPDHLERYRPGTTFTVVTMVSEKTYPNWDASLENKGDFIVLTDPALPRSGKK